MNLHEPDKLTAQTLRGKEKKKKDLLLIVVTMYVCADACFLLIGKERNIRNKGEKTARSAPASSCHLHIYKYIYI